MTFAMIEGGVDDAWMQQDGIRWVWDGRGKPGQKLIPGALQNARSMIEFSPITRGMFVRNEWRDTIEVTRGMPGDDREMYPRDLMDADEVSVAAWLSTLRLTTKETTAASLIREIASRHGYNPLTDWIEALKWDGVERLNHWLADYAGVDDTAYSQLVARRFMISAIARAIEPGCKCDTMLILEGPQGLKKSSLVEAMAPRPEYFSDQIGEITSKEGSQLIQGYWIIEVPEMNNMQRAEASAVKEFVSRKSDRYRPTYGRNVVVRGRKCVFAGTINPDGNGYIRDSTGARRFWPVTCTKIDLDGFRKVRDQLWAEALAAYQTEERWWVDGDETHIVLDEQLARIDTDVWDDPVKDYVTTRTKGEAFTSSQVLASFGLNAQHQNQTHKNRVAKILKSMGLDNKLVRQGEDVTRKWIKP